MKNKNRPNKINITKCEFEVRKYELTKSIKNLETITIHQFKSIDKRSILNHHTRPNSILHTIYDADYYDFFCYYYNNYFLDNITM